MKCPNCNGTGQEYSFYDGAESVWKDVICPTCNGTGKVEQTNEEWFCNLPTEEKAEWMAKHMSFCEVCEIVTCLGGGCERFDRSMNEKDAFEEWLKQPHKPIS